MTSVLTEHEKLARWSPAVSVQVSVPTVAPNLTAGGVTVVTAALGDSGEPLRYQVTDGGGLPPCDVHVNCTLTPSRMSPSVVLTDSCGSPGFTAYITRYH